ncbi:MAG: ammonium transporter [Tabrizicola sp.]|uniref:ammonium transporter n=1 Tax=Tabrizicola sp. TaxID=2005166 RepID=UPI00273368A8|nr:ammonium transporter [Tabrizicola sp.]MDP3262173.1 ammonium transporter [Tabrizicola sp.]MDP3648081.1 ammonium transporter [Paracoccaceae bacterium]
MIKLAKYSGLGALGASLFASLPAWAQDAAAETTEAATDVVAEVVPVMDKGDTAFMMISTVLVLFMILPGLALFYGGLVRTKNMLSLLMQSTVITALVIVIYIFWGYSMSFGDAASPYWGGLGKAFLSGVTLESMAATFSAGFVIPEFVFISFQMTFACITAVLIVGAFAERIKFGSLLVFVALWVTIVYFPIAHMVWDSDGLIYGWGALDFAGGTVVHINAGIAALVGCLIIGKRVGYGKDNMAPHSMTLTMVGASMLWVGWFGFNAGSNLEANGGAGLAMINTFTATAGATLAWVLVEIVARGKASMLGAVSGVVTGLVAVTPAAGFAGPVGAIVLGAVASVACYFFVSTVKHKLNYDDSLDVFGIHGVAGIIGAVGTAVVNDPSMGGIGYGGAAMGTQVMIQIQAVLVTIIWCGVVSAVLYYAVNAVMGLRVKEEQEREGLDLTSHGERAYNM